jgi:hypothetical protein
MLGNMISGKNSARLKEMVNQLSRNQDRYTEAINSARKGSIYAGSEDRGVQGRSILDRISDNQQRRNQKVQDIGKRINEMNQLELRKKSHLDDFLKKERLKVEANIAEYQQKIDNAQSQAELWTL